MDLRRIIYKIANFKVVLLKSNYFYQINYFFAISTIITYLNLKNN